MHFCLKRTPMLDDVIYWAEYYLAKRQDHSFRGGWLSDTLFVVTLCLLFNLLTFFYCVEFYLGWDIIQHIPITSRREFSSWLYASLFFIPILSLLYYKYFRKCRWRSFIKSYSHKSSREKIVGKIIFWSYMAGTWGGFILCLYFFNH